PVREAARQLDRHGLLALIAHHHARTNLAAAPHACFLSRRMVLMRAMSRRIVRNWSGLATGSVARRNASRNRSSSSTASFCSSSSIFSSRNVSGFCLGTSTLLAPHELGSHRQLGRREIECR